MQKRPPRHPARDTWYFNPDSVGKVWHFDGEKWNRLLAGDDRPPFLHQGLVWIPIRDNHTLATITGKILIRDARMVANNGKVFVGMSNFRDFFAVTVTGDTLSYYPFMFQGRHGLFGDPEWSHDKEGNETFDVLPQYNPALSNIRFSNWHNWGMVNSEGAWVIPPIYDGPFYFEDGLAVVTYYGEKRVINLKGEVVE